MKNINIKEIKVKDYVSESKLPDADFVINPYVGCTHACKYCYACFMKRFTGHKEEWGTFIDVKLCDKPINLNKMKDKKLFFGSVTDSYCSVEKEYEITKNILKQLVNHQCTEVGISTKSKLIARDVDLLKQIKNLVVSFSINTTDEKFRSDMDNGSTIAERIEAMKTLHDAGIKTVCFLSPMFPEITDYKSIISATKGIADIYWFENLNLRDSYKNVILNYIKENYTQHYETYNEIYNKNNKAYWHKLAIEINEFCTHENINFKNYFYHEEIRKN